MKHRLAIVATAAILVALAVPGIASAADVQVVSGKVIGTHGMLLVASSNGMTVYTFDKDVAGSGTSACTGGCLTRWPALTVAAGATPAGGSGVTGTLATITRADNGAIQVTYDGKPLYFFANDTAPGDANGIYPGWQAVVLTASVPSATAAPTAAPQAATSPAATPPPTSTAPGDHGRSPADSPLPVLLLASVAVIGFAGALRHMAVART